jgi:hypothetical protein
MCIGNRQISRKKSSQLFYIVDWLPPDFGAVGQYGTIFARGLAVAGRDVRLIGLTTGDYSTAREVLPNGKLMEITKIRSQNYKKSKFIGRLLWTVRTNMRIVYEVIRDFRSSRAEIIFAILIAGGIAPDRIYLKRDISPAEIRGDEIPIEMPGQLKDLHVLLYSGNYGVAHDSDTVVGGLIKYHSEGAGTFGLWLNAIGSRADLVEQQLREAGIPVVRSQPGQLEELPRLLVAADAHLITLRPEFSGIVLPSKVYGCIASRRPVLFVGPASSDVHVLCRDADLPAYEHVEVGDIDGFAAALHRLAERKLRIPRLKGIGGRDNERQGNTNVSPR